MSFAVSLSVVPTGDLSVPAGSPSPSPSPRERSKSAFLLSARSRRVRSSSASRRDAASRSAARFAAIPEMPNRDVVPAAVEARRVPASDTRVAPPIARDSRPRGSCPTGIRRGPGPDETPRGGARPPICNASARFDIGSPRPMSERAVFVHRSRRLLRHETGGKQSSSRKLKKSSSTDRTPWRDPQSEPRFSPTRPVRGTTRRHAVRRRDLAPGVRFPALSPRANLPRANLLVFAFLMGHSTPPFLGRDAGEDHQRTATRHWPVHGAQHDDTGHSRCASRRGCSAVIPPDPERRLTEPPLKKRVSAEPKSPVVVVVRRPRRTKSLTRFSCCFFLLPQRLLPRRRPPPAPEGEDPDFGRRVRRHSGRRVEGSRRRP